MSIDEGTLVPLGVGLQGTRPQKIATGDSDGEKDSEGKGPTSNQGHD